MKKQLLHRSTFLLTVLFLIFGAGLPVYAATSVRVPYKVLYVGETEASKISGFKGKVTYRSGNTNCFTVSQNGVVTAVGSSGNNWITLRASTANNKQWATTSLKIKVPSISGTYKLNVGQTGNLTFTSNMLGKVTWSSGNKNVITIQSQSSPNHQKCTFKAVKSGTTTIQADYMGKTYTWRVSVNPAPKPAPKPTPKPETFVAKPSRVTQKRVARLILTSTKSGSFTAKPSDGSIGICRFGNKLSANQFPLYVVGQKNGSTTIQFNQKSTGSKTTAVVTFNGMQLSAVDCRKDLINRINKTTNPLQMTRNGDICNSKITVNKNKGTIAFRTALENKTVSGTITLKINKGFTSGKLEFKGKYLRNSKPFETKTSIIPSVYVRNKKLNYEIISNKARLSKEDLKDYTNSAKDTAFFMWNLILANDYGLDLKGIGFSAYEAIYR